MIKAKTSPPEVESTTPETAGKMLAFAREKRDLSVEDVAGNLNLGVGVIDALERDQYDLLPGCPFVKGYLRSYAALLRLNPDAVIQQMAVQPEPPPDMTTFKNRKWLRRTVSKRVSKPTTKSSGLFFKSALVIILLVGVSLFGLNQLSHLDTEKLAVLLKLPIPAKAGNDTNDIMLPTQNAEN